MDTSAARRADHSGRTLAVALAGILASTVTGCGASTPGSNGAIADADLEPATVPGLAAAVLSHLDDRQVEPRGGSRNPDEGWMAVEFEVEAAGSAVPLSVMVVEAEELDLSEAGTCPARGSTVLGCLVQQAADGSPVVALTSTEDVTGGISPDGLVVMVSHARDDHLVLVVEELSSRTEEDRAMRGLPVDLEVLVDIATDPHVTHLGDAPPR